MNEHESAASQTEPAVPPREAPEKPSVLRKILFMILAVMVVALIYEYGFVLRSYRNAENTIDDMIEQSSALADEETTPQAIQRRFGKQPVNVETDDDYLVEHYQWRRWLPWKTFDIYVIYTAGDPPTLFYSTRPDPPRPEDLPMKFEGATFTGDVEMPELSPSPGAEAEPSESTVDDPASDAAPAESTGDEDAAPSRNGEEGDAADDEGAPTEDTGAADNAGKEEARAANGPDVAPDSEESPPG